MFTLSDVSMLFPSPLKPNKVLFYGLTRQLGLSLLLGFFLLWYVARHWRRFDGQIFLSYVAWYGFGRSIIEGLRTDGSTRPTALNTCI